MFRVYSCKVAGIAWVCFKLLRNVLLFALVFCSCVSVCDLLFCRDTPHWMRFSVVSRHALTCLSSCRSQRTAIAVSSWGCLAIQRGQNILTEQSVQMVHPAKSHSRKVCPKISQSLPVIEYVIAVCRGITFVFLRRLGILSPHRSNIALPF